VENLGYRQLHSWWRIQGLWAALRNASPTWGTMVRTGFATETAPPPTTTPGP